MERNITDGYLKSKKIKYILIIAMLILLIIISFFSVFVGTSRITFKETFDALFFKGDKMCQRIVWNIRMPRIFAGIIAGFGLALSGLIMQTTLRNPLASPSTLGVSNSAVFGANLGIIILGEGAFATSGLLVVNVNNPYVLALSAFVFSFISIILVLALSKIRSFSSEVVVLAGVGIGAIATAGTTMLQYYAEDNTLASAVFWSFGDLSRATYKEIIGLVAVILVSLIIFMFFQKSYNAMLFGDDVAKSLGIRVELIRFISLFLASIITALCISFLGIIGFVGIIAPHIMRRIVGNDHRFLIPLSGLLGSIVLIIADMFARGVNPSSSLPVGAVTAIIGAPVFLWIVFSRPGGKA